MSDSLWIFAYGSLIFRPDFPFVERAPARARGFTRRFHQGSPDHRGTPEYLGRVLTLVPESGGACEGIVYRVDRGHADSVLTALDEREQGGYARANVPVEVASSHLISGATTWIASPGNPYWLGPEAVGDMVSRIRRARGPSGPNVEYVLRLRDALRAHGIVDGHVEEIASALDHANGCR